jgi:hypothetical protein
LVDHAPRLQLERLEPTSPVSVDTHVQLQLERANPALSGPVAVLQLDRLQLDRA